MISLPFQPMNPCHSTQRMHLCLSTYHTVAECLSWNAALIIRLLSLTSSIAKPWKVSSSLCKKVLPALPWHLKSSSLRVQENHQYSTTCLYQYFATSCLYVSSLLSKLSYLLFPICVADFPSLGSLLQLFLPSFTTWLHPMPTYPNLTHPSRLSSKVSVPPWNLLCFWKPEMIASSSDPPEYLLFASVVTLCPALA